MKKIIILILFVFLLPICVDAATITSSLDCGSSFVRGQNVSCDIKINSSETIDGLVGNFSFDSSKMTYVSFEPKSGFSPLYAQSTGFALMNLAGKSGSFVAGTITLKINDSAKFNITGFEASSGNNNYTVNFAAMNFKLKSSNNNLNGLSLSSGSLSPSFSPSKTSYTATVNSDSVTINAVKGESVQKISGTGTKKLAYGKNTFKVIVTSEAGTKKTYTIVITRPDNRSNNNYLKSLSVSSGSIPFKNGSTKYTLNVDSNVTSLKVDATLEDSKASFVSGYGPRTVNLKYGSNNVLIKVKAENESVRTYTITVNRKDDRSSNNYLKTLTINSGTLTFVKDTLEYNVSVPFETVRIDVNAVAEDVKSKVVVNNIDLVVGNNVITVVVTSENEESRTYKINVNRLTEAAKMSDNNNVSTIDIVGHDFDFVKDVFEYDITLTNEDKLHFFVELEDEKANYVIDGNNDLKDGSVVKVISTSESGEKKEYKFNVSMKETDDSKSCSKCLLYGIIGFGLGVIVTILIFFIIKKVNKKKKDTIKEDIIVPKDNSVIESNAIVSGEAEMLKTSVDTEQSFYDNNY